MTEGTRAGNCVDMHVGETLHIDISARALVSEKISITLLYKSGLKARFRVEAGEQIAIEKTQGARRPELI